MMKFKGSYFIAGMVVLCLLFGKFAYKVMNTPAKINFQKKSQIAMNGNNPRKSHQLSEAALLSKQEIFKANKTKTSIVSQAEVVDSYMHLHKVDSYLRVRPVVRQLKNNINLGLWERNSKLQSNLQDLRFFEGTLKQYSRSKEIREGALNRVEKLNLILSSYVDLLPTQTQMTELRQKKVEAFFTNQSKSLVEIEALYQDYSKNIIWAGILGVLIVAAGIYQFGQNSYNKRYNELERDHTKIKTDFSKVLQAIRKKSFRQLSTMQIDAIPREDLINLQALIDSSSAIQLKGNSLFMLVDRNERVIWSTEKLRREFMIKDEEKSWEAILKNKFNKKRSIDDSKYFHNPIDDKRYELKTSIDKINKNKLIEIIPASKLHSTKNINGYMYKQFVGSDLAYMLRLSIQERFKGKELVKLNCPVDDKLLAVPCDVIDKTLPYVITGLKEWYSKFHNNPEIEIKYQSEFGQESFQIEMSKIVCTDNLLNYEFVHLGEKKSLSQLLADFEYLMREMKGDAHLKNIRKAGKNFTVIELSYRNERMKKEIPVKSREIVWS